MPRLLSFLVCIITVLNLSSFRCQADDLKITTIPSNSGYVETAHISHYHNEIFIEGWLKPHYWMGSSKIYFTVDVKNSRGKVIATKTGYAYPTGRPQTIVQFGVPYVISFESSQLANATAIDVRYTGLWAEK